MPRDLWEILKFVEEVYLCIYFQPKYRSVELLTEYLSTMYLDKIFDHYIGTSQNSKVKKMPQLFSQIDINIDIIVFCLPMKKFAALFSEKPCYYLQMVK